MRGSLAGFERVEVAEVDLGEAFELCEGADELASAFAK